MTVHRTLGPSAMGTLLTTDGAAVAAAYCRHLYQHIAAQDVISAQLAELWGAPALSGQPCWILANDNDHCWLRIIESPLATAPAPLKHTGWLSLEVSVTDVDGLVEELADSPFTVLRPAADLELSDKIRASQVAGPAGEVLYLTEIKGDVPPFELTPAQCRVDRLFIPVLACHDREASTVFYEQLTGQPGLRFDTKITVVNQAYGYDLATQHPVATVQLNGYSLIEIDQLDAADAPAANDDGLNLPAGIAMISFEASAVDSLKNVTTATHAQAPYLGRQHGCLRGPAGELVELIVTTPNA